MSPSASTLYQLLVLSVLDDHLAAKDGDPTNVVNFKWSVCNAIWHRFAMDDMDTVTSICVTATTHDPKFKTLNGKNSTLFIYKYISN